MAVGPPPRRTWPHRSLRAFKDAKPVAAPHAPSGTQPAAGRTAATTVSGSPDDVVVVVPAQEESFKTIFLGENRWRSIRISGGKLQQIRYVAVYQTRPVMAVTHYAPVATIEPYGEDGKYQLIFSGPAVDVGPIPFADAPAAAMMGPHYTTLGKLMGAKKLMDLF